MGCDHVQGFLISAALPAADFEAFARARMAASTPA
jgi:EAL domain-containing protein (putative c-di-GMP-specific phosphodiesterase class I)